MAIANELQSDFNEVLKYGDLIRLKYYNVGFVGSYYDDNVTLTQSGTDLWTSGLIQPVGATDSLLLQQGKILSEDMKVYVGGNIQTSGLGPIKIGLGSTTIMTGQEYSLITTGVTEWDVNATPILKKLFIRNLPTGSLDGE